MSTDTDVASQTEWPVRHEYRYLDAPLFDVGYVATVSDSLVNIMFTNGYQIERETSSRSGAVDVFHTGVWIGEFRFLTDLSIEGLAQYLRSYLNESPAHCLYIAEVEAPHVGGSR